VDDEVGVLDRGLWRGVGGVGRWGRRWAGSAVWVEKQQRSEEAVAQAGPGSGQSAKRGGRCIALQHARLDH